MKPTLAVRKRMATLLAADATTLAPAVDKNKLVPIMNNFASNENTVIGDLTPADFTGSAGIEGTTGAQPVALDPLTNDSIIDIKPPLGGYRWVTTDSTNLPQTIYGFALLDNAEAVLLASAKLDVPVVLTLAGQLLEYADPTLRLPAGSIS